MLTRYKLEARLAHCKGMELGDGRSQVQGRTTASFILLKKGKKKRRANLKHKHHSILM